MATKERVAKMQYLDADGKDMGSNAQPGLASIRFDFVDKTGEDKNGKPIYVVTESETIAFDSIGDKAWGSCAAHGLKQKLSDAYAGSKGRNESPYDDFMSMVEQLQNDEWSIKREGSGPRPSMVSEALHLALLAMGAVDDEALMAQVMASTNDADKRKSALANPAVKAEFATLQANAAVERADKAAKAAAKAGATGGLNLQALLGPDEDESEDESDEDTPVNEQENDPANEPVT